MNNNASEKYKELLDTKRELLLVENSGKSVNSADGAKQDEALRIFEKYYLEAKALFAEGSIESANLLIEYFGADNLNAYFASKGYKDTFFGGTIGNTAESYTSTADVIKLIKKMYDNANFFPYSDMYQKMLSNSTDDKIAKLIPQGTNIANISFATEEEVFDAAVVYTPEGAFVFTAMANEFYDSPEKSYAAISAAAKGIYGLIK